MIINIVNNINLITVALAGIFIIPVISGAFHSFSGKRKEHFLISMFDTLESLISIVLAFYITGLAFSTAGRSYMTDMFEGIPFIQALFSDQSIWHYIIAMLILLTVINGVLRLLTIPIYRYLLNPLSDRISTAVHARPPAARALIGGIFQLPRSVCLVLIFSLLLNLYSDYLGDAAQIQYIKSSAAYQFVDRNALQPLLGSPLAKQVPVLLKDSFEKAAESIPQNAGSPRVIEYFNGMTLDEAIKSSDDIDSAAQKIAINGKNDKKKAYLLYEWISQNIEYDYKKADIINTNPASNAVSAGSIDAYTTRKGVCFDYACLYVSMCRAVGLKVRLVTGLGYSGSAWGDHAWNQVYSSEEKRWINVDTTFGSTGGDFFDQTDFFLTHKNAEVQGEW